MSHPIPAVDDDPEQRRHLGRVRCGAPGSATRPVIVMPFKLRPADLSRRGRIADVVRTGEGAGA